MKVRLVGKDSRQQLLLTATWANGSQRDVTREVAFRCADGAVAKIGADGVVQPVGSGRTIIEVVTPGKRIEIPIEVERGDSLLPVDFARDIVPILTKTGCNGGGCHGKSGGRGGFQLSLFGFDPISDFDAIVKGSRGRKISVSSPDHS
ncbi:MAG: S-layer protein, partial [Planctomycetes bacterium]|nr:S-layer protein [Planctomycetota bacterium]